MQHIAFEAERVAVQVGSEVVTTEMMQMALDSGALPDLLSDGHSPVQDRRAMQLESFGGGIAGIGSTMVTSVLISSDRAASGGSLFVLVVGMLLTLAGAVLLTAKTANPSP